MKVKNYSLKVKDRVLLDNVTFNIQTGALNIIMGRNGTGKTLLLDVISDLDGHRSQEFIAFPDSKDLVYLSQGVPFIAEVTVEQTINFIMGLAGQHEILNFPKNLEEKRKVRFGNLSGGERRFLIVWSVLQLDRALYILDEPFANIDVVIVKELLKLIEQKVYEGKTVILSSHQYEGINTGNIIFFENTSVKFEGPVQDFKEKFGSLENAFSEN
jgi:ABC-2 type transport system ATP-binding protein